MVNALLESATLLQPGCEEQLRMLLAQEKLLIFLGSATDKIKEDLRALLQSTGRMAPVLVADQELRSRGSNHIRHAIALHPPEFEDELVVRVQQDDFHPDMPALLRYRELADQNPDLLLPILAAEEYIDGERMVTVAPYLRSASDLLSVIMRKKTGFAEHLRYVQGLTKSLALLHENNLAHRDVKPSNIFIDQDRVILGDPDLVVPFGPVRMGSVGTRMFMPPELGSKSVGDRTIGGWTDIYGAGVVLQCLNADFPGDGQHTPLKKWHDTPLQKSIRRIADSCTAALPQLRPTVAELQSSLASVQGAMQDPAVAPLEECSHKFLFLLRVAEQHPDQLDEAIATGETLKTLLPAREQAFLLYHLGSLRTLRGKNASVDSSADRALAQHELRHSLRLDPYTAGVHAAFALDALEGNESNAEHPWLITATLLNPGEHRPEPDVWIWQYLRASHPEFSAACDAMRSEAGLRSEIDTASNVVMELPAAFAALSEDERLRCTVLLHNCVRIAYMRGTPEGLREALAMADVVRIIIEKEDLPASFRIMCADAWRQLEDFNATDSDDEVVALRYDLNRTAAWKEVLEHHSVEPDVMEIYLRENADTLSPEAVQSIVAGIAPVRRTPVLLTMLAGALSDTEQRTRLLRDAYLLNPADPETNFALAHDALSLRNLDIAALIQYLRKVLLIDAQIGEVFLRQTKDLLIEKLSFATASEMSAFIDMWLETKPSFAVCIPLTDICNRLGFAELVRKLNIYQRSSDLESLVSTVANPDFSGRTGFTGQPLQRSASLRQSSAGFGAHAVDAFREAIEHLQTAQTPEDGMEHCLTCTIPTLLPRTSSCVMLLEGDPRPEPLIRRSGLLVAEPGEEMLTLFERDPHIVEQKIDADDGYIIVATAPIFAGGTVVGFLHIERRVSFAHKKDDGEVAGVAEAVSGLLGGAASIRLLHQREAQVLAAEATMAEVERIQRGVLPGSKFKTERTNWGAVWQPGERNAGGDGYHWCRLPNGKVFSCLFDVQGHGAGAASYANNVIMNIRRESTNFSDLPTFVHDVNNGMYRSLNPAEFSVHIAEDSPVPDTKLATGVFLTFDEQSKMLQAMSAGHGLPMIFLDDVPYAYPDSDASKGILPMNIMNFDRENCTENCVTVDLGATGAASCTVALFSDGLNESFHKERPTELLGMENLRDLILRTKEPDPQKRAELVLAEIKRTHNTHDDCTLLLAYIDLLK